MLVVVMPRESRDAITRSTQGLNGYCSHGDRTMPWISMSANRHLFEPGAPEDALDLAETFQVAEEMRFAYSRGDRDTLRAWNVASVPARSTIASWLKRERGGLPLAVVAELATLELADAITAVRPAPLPKVNRRRGKDEEAQHALTLLSGRSPVEMTGRKALPKGHVYTRAALTRAMIAGSPERALALVTTPDHPAYPSLEPWTPILALALCRTLPAPERATALWHMVHNGVAPFARRIIFERRRAPTEYGNRRDAKWRGFDAVEIREAEVIAYHYLGVRWHAPLLFEGELDAFWFLGMLDEAWRELKDSVGTATWKLIEEARSHKRVRHIVVHDENKVPTSVDDLGRAAKHYGVQLEAVDLMRA